MSIRADFIRASRAEYPNMPIRLIVRAMDEASDDPEEATRLLDEHVRKFSGRLIAAGIIRDHRGDIIATNLNGVVTTEEEWSESVGHWR